MTEAERGAALMKEIGDRSAGVKNPWCVVTFDELAAMMAAPGRERLFFPRGGYPWLGVPDDAGVLRAVVLYPEPDERALCEFPSVRGSTP